MKTQRLFTATCMKRSDNKSLAERSQQKQFKFTDNFHKNTAEAIIQRLSVLSQHCWNVPQSSSST